MTQDGGKTNDTEKTIPTETKYSPFYGSSGARKSIILVLIGVWLVGFFSNCEKAEWKSFIILASLIMLYFVEVLYAITISTKTSEFFKSFIFQTAVPIVALVIVCIMTLTDKIKETSVLTLLKYDVFHGYQS